VTELVQALRVVVPEPRAVEGVEVAGAAIGVGPPPPQQRRICAVFAKGTGLDHYSGGRSTWIR
jgi:hypothetical protein